MEKLRFVVVVDVEQVGDGLPGDEVAAALSLEIQAAVGSKEPILDVHGNAAALVKRVDVQWSHDR